MIARPMYLFRQNFTMSQNIYVHIRSSSVTSDLSFIYVCCLFYWGCFAQISMMLKFLQLKCTTICSICLDLHYNKVRDIFKQGIFPSRNCKQVTIYCFMVSVYIEIVKRKKIDLQYNIDHHFLINVILKM